MQPRHLSTSFLLPAMLLISVLLLGGCGEKKDPPPQADPDVARAAQLLSLKDYPGASALYQGLAARTPGSEGYGYLLQAADATLLGGDLDGTARLLEQAGTLPLEPDQALLLTLLRSELAMAARQSEPALRALLAHPLPPNTPEPLARRYHRDLAKAYRLNGNLLESANSLQRLDALLINAEQRLETQTEILRSLALLNELVLVNLQPSPPGVQGGWMQLALLVKQYGDDDLLMQSELQAWRGRFPAHPALPELLASYQARLQAQIQQPQQVAILLPQTGPYATAAAALRDGMLASLYDQAPEKRPVLRFYDSADTQNTWPLFSQAVSDGAQLIIGPLQKDAVVQLARAGELPVPVLALNQVEIDSVPPVNFFMYSLSPEDEARQAAERIWLDELRLPLMLTPQGDWGDRIARAFAGRWLALTGDEVDFRTYDPESTDFSPAITSLLQLDQSKARRRQIETWLGQKVEFEPRRRQDVDAMFVVARPRQAQSIRPLLQFHHAADLPTYATSHAWRGSLDSRQLADMRGMVLADVPLLIDDGQRKQLAESLPGVKGPLVRLYAMGMDAMKLTPHLQRLHSSSFESLDGNTGNLFMDPQQRILRQTVWMKLDQPVKILGYAARLDLPEESPLAPASGAMPGGLVEPAAPVTQPAAPSS